MVTRGGRVESCRNFSQCSRHGATSPGGGRDVGSSCDRAARLANPILNLAKTSGGPEPLNARHQFFVQLAGKPDAKRKFLEARDAVLESHYIIANFSKVLGTAIHGSRS